MPGNCCAFFGSPSGSKYRKLDKDRVHSMGEPDSSTTPPLRTGVCFLSDWGMTRNLLEVVGRIMALPSEKIV